MKSKLRPCECDRNDVNFAGIHYCVKPFHIKKNILFFEDFIKQAIKIIKNYQIEKINGFCGYIFYNEIEEKIKYYRSMDKKDFCDCNDFDYSYNPIYDDDFEEKICEKCGFSYTLTETVYYSKIIENGTLIPVLKEKLNLLKSIVINMCKIITRKQIYQFFGLRNWYYNYLIDNLSENRTDETQVKFCIQELYRVFEN